MNKPFIFDNCNFNPRNFKNYLCFNNLDPTVDLTKLEKKEEKFFICSNCPHENCNCIITDVLFSSFKSKN